MSSIRLVGTILGKGVEFLIDTGTTYNFMDSNTALCLGLSSSEVNRFEVEVANGEKITRGECCKDIKLSIQGFESSTDLLIVPLEDSQVILGTIWLKNLDLTLWDFNKRTLHFWKEGRNITLQGVQPETVDVLEGKILNKMLQLKGFAYMLQYISEAKKEKHEECPEM